MITPAGFFVDKEGYPVGSSPKARRKNRSGSTPNDSISIGAEEALEERVHVDELNVRQKPAAVANALMIRESDFSGVKPTADI